MFRTAARLGAMAVKGLLKRRRSSNVSSRRVRPRTSRRPAIRSSRSRTRISVRRRRRTENGGAASGPGREMRKINVKYGRRFRKTLRNAYRIIKQSNSVVTFSREETQPLGAANGTHWLAHNVAPGGFMEASNISLIPITCVVNQVQPGSTLVNPFTLFKLGFTSETTSGAVSFTGAANLNVTHTQGSNVGTWVPHERSILRWVAFKMLFYSANDIANRLQVELISLKDDRLHPDFLPVTAVDASFRTGFWQYMTKQFTRNPCSLMETTYKRYYRVHKRIALYVDSKDTDQTVQSNQREINFYMRLNRSCVYNWNPSDTVNMNTADVQANFGENRTDVKPSQRLYILIRCNSQRTASVDEYDRRYHPSFDYSVRMSHLISQ